MAVIACERIFAPFIPIMVWALILAIALNPLLAMIRSKTGWSPGRAATLLVLNTILLIGVPSVMLGSSFATHIFDVIGNFDATEVTVPQPKESCEGMARDRRACVSAWTAAAADLPSFIEELQPQLGNFAKSALQAAASTAGTLFFFFGALIVAGIMMAYGESGGNAMGRVFRRIAGDEKGPTLHKLSTLTVRSVAMGVVGVAVIQALLLGMGFLLAAYPPRVSWRSSPWLSVSCSCPH